MPKAVRWRGLRISAASRLCSTSLPDESIQFHGSRNHFSAWLKARTEFWLAHELRPRQLEDYASISELREDLIRRLREFRLGQQRGNIVDFDPATFGHAGSLAKIGGGSLGGKGRGLAFTNRLIEAYGVANKFDGVSVAVPPAVVLGTDVFDEFVDGNDLREFALHSTDDEELARRFREAVLPEEPAAQLHAFIESIEYPLAVRSSSILEDSRRQPFAGVYDTVLLANAGGDVSARLAALLDAVKQVYASTFLQRAKAYVEATAHRIEEEKMAVVIQRLEGAEHGGRFYPDFSGVARSHNFYPTAPQTSEDGIASVALGLGMIVVEGGAALRFCPRYPHNLMQFATLEDALDYSQRDFFALDPAGLVRHRIRPGGRRSPTPRARGGRGRRYAQARRLDLLAGERRDLRRTVPEGDPSRHLRTDAQAGDVPARPDPGATCWSSDAGA